MGSSMVACGLLRHTKAMGGGELQGWYRDPFGLHEKRYISAGRPTKLVRDGQVDSYDEPPSTAHVMAADVPGEQGFERGAAAGTDGYTAVAPRQAYAGYDPRVPDPRFADPRVPDPPAWSPWRAYARAVMAVVVIATAAILAVVVSDGGSDQPSWAKSLGARVTVDAPAAASPGHGSPGAAVSGFFAAVKAKNWTTLCEYAGSPLHTECARLPAQTEVTQALFPDVRNIALGYIATDGSAALVGTTGTFCPAFTLSSGCYTNDDPAAILSSGKPFTTLWTEALTTNGNAYSLVPCIKEGSNWYIYLPTPS